MSGASAENIPHLRMGAQRKYGLIDIDSIDVQPENWQDVRDPFAPPPDKLSMEFSGFNILDRQSCSACQSTLFMFLKRYGKKLREGISNEKEIVIAIGKGHEDLPEGTLCVGNCTIKHKKCGVFVSGCPPVASAILNEYFKGK